MPRKALRGMDYTAIQHEQQEILDRIYNSPRVKETRQVSGILQALRRCSTDDVTFLMGCVGLRFQSFAMRIDLDDPHPDLFRIHQGELGQWRSDSLNQLLCDFVHLAQCMRSNDWHSVICETLHQILMKQPGIDSLLRQIDDPMHNLLNIRFVGDRAVRDRIRSRKMLQHIGLGSVHGATTWRDLAKDFRSYWRCANYLQPDIDKAVACQEHFSNLGLQSMAQEIQRSIDQMKTEAESDQYCGFNCITLQMAAAIIAKMCGCQWREQDFFMPPNAFAGYDFYNPRCDSAGSGCCPTCQPLVNVPDVPDGIKKLVDFLEVYPEISGHPLFDNYWVLMPSFEYPSNSYFRDMQGNRHDFDRVCDSQAAFEKYLFDQHYIVGVLLGERDGGHYFISYWM